VHASLALSYLLLLTALMRALLVQTRVLPPTCGRCGLRLERGRLGEQVCSCGR
jgi:hypothetical protein